VSRPPVSFADTSAEHDPFPWFHVRETFTAERAAQLRASFPQDGFEMVARDGQDKSYAMYHRLLHPDGDGGTSGLEPVWKEFVEYVTGPEYRAEVARLTGLELGSASVEVNVWRYAHNCWLAPHVDKPAKLVTHVLYFNDDWPQDRGGDLLLLGSAGQDDVRRRVAPVANSGVLLVRGDRSWHAVERVQPGPAPVERLSAQVVFHEGELH
jgi:SM-20-related protein